MRWFPSFVLAASLALAAFGAPGEVRAQDGAPATMAEYWAGKARWSFVRKWSESGASHIEVANGVWYLFERFAPGGTCLLKAKPGIPAHTMPLIGTSVRKSTNRGATWGPYAGILLPKPGTPYSCAVTDGDAIYDAANNKWRYLFQCMDEDEVWRGCYAEHIGSDPTVPSVEFSTQGIPNPVIQSGSLWNLICNSSSDDCSTLAGGVGRVFDEGTFNIFQFDGTFYWVSFHGYDGVRGYRGIAKTRDFINWIAGDPAQGVPRDAIVDLKDGRSWRESWAGGNPIGAGAGSILIENGIAYLAVEVADMNLGCTPGQRWDWGLFRSASLASTTWEQLPQGNPFVYSADFGGQTPACSVAYGQLFRDPGDNTIYFKYFRSSSDPNVRGTYLYKLVKSSNVLKNGDLWMGGTDYWARFPIGPTNLKVNRDPGGSSDGNQYLATDCGTNATSCQPGQSIYQDVSAASMAGQWLTFGGKFATEAGAGSLDLAVLQLDPTYRILRADTVRVNADPVYRSSQSAAIPILPGTSVLRYQPYLLTPAKFRADEMFLNVTPSAAGCSMGLSWNMNSAGIGHIIGRADADGWSANVTQDAAGFLQFGPYTTQLAAGTHIAKWALMIDNNSVDDLPVVRLEVSDATIGQTLLATRDITRRQWSVPGQYACFALPFTLDASRAGHQIEFRVWWYDRAYIREQRVGVD